MLPALRDWWSAPPRWRVPALGLATVVVVGVLSLAGLSLGTTVVLLLVCLAVGAGLSAVAYDRDTEEYRPGLPLTIAACGGLLLATEGGYLLPVLAILVWPGYVVGAAYGASRRVPIVLLGVGLIATLAFDVLVFFVWWNPA
jgi:hypothetical protein